VSGPPAGEFALLSTVREIDGSRLRCSRFPGGLEDPSRALICVPGYGALGECFARLAPLANVFDMNLLTPPEDGHRRPDVLAHHASLVASFARRFDRPVLLGTSFGGPVAIEAAAQLGEACGGLILISTYAALRDHPLRRLIPIIGWLEAFANAVQRVGVYFVGGPDLDRDAARELLRQTRSISRSEKHARLLNALTCDAERAASRIRVPTLVIHGERDRMVPLERGRALAAAIPGAELHVIPGAGHVPYVTHPAAVVDQLAAFARRISHSR
jgi:pimeloyl-ACP methyl ester carboxylesterase